MRAAVSHNSSIVNKLEKENENHDELVIKITSNNV